MRVNLHPSAWRDAAHMSAYINESKATLWLDDPLAFTELQKLQIDHAPQTFSRGNEVKPLSRQHATLTCRFPVIERVIVLGWFMVGHKRFLLG